MYLSCLAGLQYCRHTAVMRNLQMPLCLQSFGKKKKLQWYNIIYSDSTVLGERQSLLAVSDKHSLHAQRACLGTASGFFAVTGGEMCRVYPRHQTGCEVYVVIASLWQKHKPCLSSLCVRRRNNLLDAWSPSRTVSRSCWSSARLFLRGSAVNAGVAFELFFFCGCEPVWNWTVLWLCRQQTRLFTKWIEVFRWGFTTCTCTHTRKDLKLNGVVVYLSLKCCFFPLLRAICFLVLSHLMKLFQIIR